MKPGFGSLRSNLNRINAMSVTDKLLADIIIVGIICGLYLQFKGFKIMKAVPASVERGNRPLTRDESLKLAASIGYAFMGAWFELLSISHAIFA
jgi:uncharacterized membrane protein